MLLRNITSHPLGAAENLQLTRIVVAARKIVMGCLLLLPLRIARGRKWDCHDLLRTGEGRRGW